MTAKQRCVTLGSLFLFVGIIFVLIGNYLNSQNRTLIADVEIADSYVRDANRQLEAPHIVTMDQRQKTMETAGTAVQKWLKADQRFRDNAYSSALINLLFAGGSFLSLFGFVLIVVGWIIPENR